MASTTITTIIFDFNGVLHDRYGLDDELLSLIEVFAESYKIGLLTSFTASALAPLFPSEQRRAFSQILTRERMNNDKPDPAVFLEAAKLMDDEVSACLMVDDSKANVEGALQAGLQAVQYRTIADVTNYLAQQSKS